MDHSTSFLYFFTHSNAVNLSYPVVLGIQQHHIEGAANGKFDGHKYVDSVKLSSVYHFIFYFLRFKISSFLILLSRSVYFPFHHSMFSFA